MECKIIDKMRIYLGGIYGTKPMVEVTYMIDGVKQNPVDLAWDESQVREEKIFPYINGYTIIDDTRMSK